MTKIRKQHNKQLKFQASISLLKEDKTITQISQEYGIHQSVLHKWKAKLMEHGPDIFDEKICKKSDENRRIYDLERKIGQLTMELDFLKKALGQ